MVVLSITSRMDFKARNFTLRISIHQWAKPPDFSNIDFSNKEDLGNEEFSQLCQETYFKVPHYSCQSHRHGGDYIRAVCTSRHVVRSFGRTWLLMDRRRKKEDGRQMFGRTLRQKTTTGDKIRIPFYSLDCCSREENCFGVCKPSFCSSRQRTFFYTISQVLCASLIYFIPSFSSLVNNTLLNCSKGIT